MGNKKKIPRRVTGGNPAVQHIRCFACCRALVNLTEEASQMRQMHHHRPDPRAPRYQVEPKDQQHNLWSRDIRTSWVVLHHHPIKQLHKDLHQVGSIAACRGIGLIPRPWFEGGCISAMARQTNCICHSSSIQFEFGLHGLWRGRNLIKCFCIFKTQCSLRSKECCSQKFGDSTQKKCRCTFTVALKCTTCDWNEHCQLGNFIAFIDGWWVEMI